MALDPRISLMGDQPTFSLLDWGPVLARGQQLRGNQMVLAEEQRQLQEAAAIREAYAQQYGGAPAGLAGVTPMAPPGPTPVTERQLGGGPTAMAPYAQAPPGGPQAPMGLAGLQGLGGAAAAPVAGSPGQQQAFLRELYRVSPKAGMEAEDRLLKQHLDRVEYLGRVAEGVLDSPNPQAAHEVGRQMLIDYGMPPGQIPATYDKKLWSMYAGVARDSADKLRLAQARHAEAQAGREEREAQAATEMRETEGAPPARAAGTGQVAPPSRGKPSRMSEADIADAIKETGKSRAEVIAAARRQGIAVPGEPPASEPAPPPRTGTPWAPRAGAPDAEPPVAAAPPPTPAPVAPPRPAPAQREFQGSQARDEQRVRRLEDERTQVENRIAEARRRWGGTAVGQKRIDDAQQDLSRINTELSQVRSRMQHAAEKERERTTPSAAVRDELLAMDLDPAAATPAQRQAALKRIEARQLGLEEAKPLAEERGKRQARERMSLQEAVQDDSERFWDTTTARPLTGAENYLDTERRQTQGEVKRLTQTAQKKMEAFDQAIPLLQQAQWYFDQVWGENGVFTQLSDTERGQLAMGAGWAQLRQRTPVLANAERFMNNLAPQLARTLGGEVGALSDQDVERIRDLLPRFGVGVDLWKLKLTAPDTYRTALGAMDDLTSMFEGAMGRLLGKRDFQHPELKRYVRPEEWITPGERQGLGRGYVPQGELPQLPGTRPLGREGFGRSVVPR